MIYFYEKCKVEYTLHEVIKNRISFDEQWLKKVFFSSNKLHYLINVTADCNFYKMNYLVTKSFIQEINIATGLSLAHAVTEVKIELKINLMKLFNILSNATYSNVEKLLFIQL
ncbi:hypothetical protein T12_15020 [Trichinella patagoniensis]|uniref:Uncharacterized protein n=1 Tax=Trichinella patagoniensis TaxID=990121 RepID=A0A0V1A6Z8_9BILA|nr:hypothetical protein T12_15020 [Trichinella patagoniensis]